MTVQVAVAPEDNDVGAHTSDVNAPGSVTVTKAVVEAPLAVAVMVTVVGVETELAVAVNVAIVLPAATLTEAGTLRALLLSATETSRPPEGATLVRVTVQEIVAPGDREAGAQIRVEGTV